MASELTVTHNSGEASRKTIFREGIQHYNKADPAMYLDTKIRELKELIRDRIIVSNLELEDQFKVRRIKILSQALSIVGAAATTVYGNLLINDFKITEHTLQLT